MHLRLILAVVLATLAAAPAATHAATLTTTQSTSTGPHDEVYYDITLTLRAAPGEHNDVTVRTERNPVPGTAFAYPAFVITDTGGTPLTPADGCTAEPDGSVRCAPKGGSSFTFAADLGDGDDRVTVQDPEEGSGVVGFTLDGGDGNDVLDARAVKGIALVRFDGGAGDDTELGGGSSSEFTGDPGHDRIAGGPGEDDQLSYRLRSDTIRATLGAPEPGDEDDISGVEALKGGTGDDRLTGSDGPDWITGGGGHDVIDGRAGDDRLYDTDPSDEPAAHAVITGGAGDDTIELEGASRAAGGAGADSIFGSAHATVAGGPGRDTLTAGRVTADDDGAGGDFVTCLGRAGAAVLGRGDVSAGCRVRRTAGLKGLVAIDRRDPVDVFSTSATGLIMKLWCADEAPAGGCPARVTVVDAAGHAVAQKRVKLRRGTARGAEITYNKSFARRLGKAGALAVTLVASARDRRGAVRSDRLRYCAQAQSRLDRDRPLACR
jgi:Ca2+-binding RTX toxin-like protein